MQHLDLKLLRVFMALFEERSALRAGEQLGITQSAVSHALARLREHFGDPLFVRGAGGLQPTPRAAEIGPLLSLSFAHMQDALAPSHFEPATTSRTFTIAVPHYLCELVFPFVVARASREAPHARFRFWNSSDVSRSLDEGKVDLAVGSYELTTQRFCSEVLYEDELVWVAGAHVALEDQPITPEAIAVTPRVMVAAMKDYRGVDGRVDEGGIRRRVVSGSDESLEERGATKVSPAQISVFDAQVAVTMAKVNPVLAYVPRSLANAHRDTGLRILDGAESGLPFSVSAIWRKAADSDPALKWFRRILKDVAVAQSQSR